MSLSDNLLIELDCLLKLASSTLFHEGLLEEIMGGLRPESGWAKQETADRKNQG
ncbi:hypothetical protein ACFL6R_06345 [Gemmatimonadota bacterium]